MRERPAPPCPRHPDALAEVACASCGRPLCDVCWAFEVDEAPWCRHCVEHIHDRSPAAFPLAFLGGTGTLLGALYLRFQHAEHAAEVALGALVALFATAGFLFRRASQVSSGRAIVERKSVGPAPFDARQGYRTNASSPRLGELVPPVSGELSTLIVLLCLALPIAVAPGLRGVSTWVAIETLVGLWWLTFFVVLATLLYRGSRLADDGPSLSDARAGEREDAGGTGSSAKSWGDGCSGLDGLGSLGGEGCGGLAGFLAVLAAFALLMLAAYLLAEFVLPLLFSAAYYVVSRGLRRVANDTHACRGDLLRSLGWALAWSLLYTLPVALVASFAGGLLGER